MPTAPSPVPLLRTRALTVKWSKRSVSVGGFEAMSLYAMIRVRSVVPAAVLLYVPALTDQLPDAGCHCSSSGTKSSRTMTAVGGS